MKKHISYHLRRPLALSRAQRELKTIIPYCKQNHIDDVIWFFDAGMHHKGLDTAEETRAFVPFLKKARTVLGLYGITSSINVWNTYGGHAHNNRNPLTALKKFEPLTDWRGKESKFWPCPLSPAFKDWISGHYAILAESEPHTIWVDDDMRNLPRAGLDCNCYCPLHLKRFAEIAGLPQVSREELIKNILAPGKPHPWRALWLSVLNQGLTESAALIEGAVHRVSPQTRVAQMTSAAFNHEIEGRNYPKVLKTLAGPHDPMVRISLSGYQETHLRAIYWQDENIRQTITILPAGTERCSEIDNCPNSLYAKSAAWMIGQMRHCCITGVPHQTLAIHAHDGTDPDVEPQVGEMLRKSRPHLETLSRMFCGDGDFRGVRLLGHPAIANLIDMRGRPETPTSFCSLGTGWADALRGFGFPIVFSGEQPVTAITGQVLRGYADRLDEIFSRGVLLDYSALETLQDMGRADLAGVEAVRRYHSGEEPTVLAELLTDPGFGGGQGVYAMVPAGLGVLKPLNGCRALSICQDHNVKDVFPGLTAFTNKLGGRCCVYAYDFAGNAPDMFTKATAPYFYNLTRKKQLGKVLNWLGQGFIPLQVNAVGWILPHRVDFSDRIMLAAMNLNLDDWNKIEFKAAITPRVRRVQLLIKGRSFE
ncbi:MAG: hypothetical protein KKA81_17265, partial [Bacteroidetes bacterium]|nr:hypothetical protein [Bacteroidota bacterium]